MRKTTCMPWNGLRGWLLRGLFRPLLRMLAWEGFGDALLRPRRRLLRLCFRLYLGRSLFVAGRRGTHRRIGSNPGSQSGRGGRLLA